MLLQETVVGESVQREENRLLKEARCLHIPELQHETHTTLIDTKYDLAWNKNTVMLAFRGTKKNSWPNIYSDLKVYSETCLSWVLEQSSLLTIKSTFAQCSHDVWKTAQLKFSMRFTSQKLLSWVWQNTRLTTRMQRHCLSKRHCQKHSLLVFSLSHLMIFILVAYRACSHLWPKSCRLCQQTITISPIEEQSFAEQGCTWVSIKPGPMMAFMKALRRNWRIYTSRGRSTRATILFMSQVACGAILAVALQAWLSHRPAP